jgi:tRNA threonylcarbamoyladenosine biosynthesis protein TsaE
MMRAKIVSGHGTGKWPGSLPEPGGSFSVATRSAEETVEFGRSLAGKLKAPLLIGLEGELGSGKTTLAKGIVSGLGAAIESDVTSPSFTLVHEYGDAGEVTHLDLYRVESPQELSTLGLEDILGRQSVVLVEWGEKLGENIAGPRLRIRLEYTGENGRRILVETIQG